MASAILDAQSDKTKQIEMAATAAAEAARQKGQGEADAKFASFQAEANGLREVQKSPSRGQPKPAVDRTQKNRGREGPRRPLERALSAGDDKRRRRRADAQRRRPRRLNPNS